MEELFQLEDVPSTDGDLVATRGKAELQATITRADGTVEELFIDGTVTACDN